MYLRRMRSVILTNYTVMALILHALLFPPSDAATLTGQSNLIVSIKSDVFFEWFFDNLVGQQMIAIEFGVMESSSRVKLVDVQPVGSGSVFPITPWPSTFAWYQNRISWAGVLSSGRITFKLSNSTLKDSNKFYCGVDWKNPVDGKVSIINLSIVDATTLTSPSKVMFALNSDAILKWFFDNNDGQQVKSIQFGVMDSGTRVKLFDVQPSGSGSAFPQLHWPSTFVWYQNRISWAGDLTSKRITFKIISSTLKDSNKFYCRLIWKNPVDVRVNTINLLIVVRRDQEPKTTAHSTGESLNSAYWSITAILAVLNILQLLYNIWIHRKMKDIEDKKRRLIDKRSSNFVSKEQNFEDDEEQNQLSSPSVKESDIALVSMERSWEVSRDQVSLVKIIGKGAFGQVAKAKIKNVPNVKRDETVAVKMLKENAAATDKKDLLSELEVMKGLRPHRHVIKLLGCVTKTDPLMVIIEYVPYGDLLGYLRKSRGLNDTYYKDPDIKPKSTLTSQQLIKFSWQVADGMAYLSERKIIHRDLAARNVLVGEGETCKVTDFGMARDVQQEDIYTKTSKGRLPVKWTSYESLLYGKYTTQSDVWSYGVLLFEIFTIGGCPYPGMKGHRIAQLLQDGYRMPKPQHVQQTLYQMMLDCWQENPDARPTFPSLRDILRGMEKNHVMYVNLKDYNSQLYESLDDLHGVQ